MLNARWRNLLVLEPDIDLTERSVHERDLLEVFAYTDYEDCSAESASLREVSIRARELGLRRETHIYAGVNRALDTSAFNHKLSLLAQRLFDLLADGLWFLAHLHMNSPHTRHKFLRKCKPTLIDICYDNRCSASSISAQENDNANRSSATYHKRIAHSHSGAVDSSKSHAQRFQKSAFFECQRVWQLVQPSFWVAMVSSQSAINRRRRVENLFWTPVVLPCSTEIAGWLGAWDAAFERDAVA